MTGTTPIDTIIQGDALTRLKELPSEAVDCCITSPPYFGSKRLLSMADLLQNMVRNNKGRFVKGVRSSPNTEFKKGQHWREPKPYWEKEWLYNEYVVKGRSLGDIAAGFGVTEPAIRFWAQKHHIRTRTVSEARDIKYWGLPGEKNGMYGIRGDKNPHWRGGITPERQALYSSTDWADLVKRVWERDEATCGRCGKRYNGEKRFHIHHITPFEKKDRRLDITNLILLCAGCHKFVHSKMNIGGEFIDE